MKTVKFLWSVVTAAVSLLTILQHIALVLPDDTEKWSSFERFLNGMLRADYWIWILLILVILLVALTIADIILSNTKRHRFKVQSPRFKKFFKKWYSQSGKLAIICDDIDWTRDRDDQSIFHVLEEKCAEGLTLYLGKGYNSDLVNQLCEKGAKVVQAKPSLIQEYSFSCLAPMGHFSNIIIREKRADAGQCVQFSELSNEHVIALLIALLEDA